MRIGVKNVNSVLNQFTSAVAELGTDRVMDAINKAKKEYKQTDFKSITTIVDIVCSKFGVNKKLLFRKRVTGDALVALMTCYCLMRDYEGYSDINLSEFFDKNRGSVYRLRILREDYRCRKSQEDKSLMLKYDLSEKEVKKIYVSENAESK